MEHVIGGKYKLGRKIGSGSFGELYLGIFCVFYLQNGCDLLTRNPFLFFLVWLFLAQVLIYRTERKWE